MKIKRENPRKRMNIVALGCGCFAGLGVLAVAVVALVLIIFAPNLLLQSAGFERVGDTNSVFENTNQSRPVLENVQSEPDSVVVQAGNLGQQTINNADIQVGTINGEQTVQLTLSESDLLVLCQQISSTCSGNGTTINNVRFDLRSGGMVVYADVLIEQVNIWQSVGVVMRLTQNNQLAVSGVDIDGQLYAAPPNDIGTTIAEIESIANDVLRQLTVQADGSIFTLDSLYIDDSSLVATLR